jgi:uncharacterized membrane protein
VAISPENSVDLSVIGSDLTISGQPTPMAEKEQKYLALEHARENNRHNAEIEERKLGVIGRFFGSKDNAIIYVVAFLVLVCIVLAGVIGFQEKDLRPQAFEFFKTVAIALVGFFAGRALPNKDE